MAREDWPMSFSDLEMGSERTHLVWLLGQKVKVKAKFIQKQAKFLVYPSSDRLMLHSSCETGPTSREKVWDPRLEARPCRRRRLCTVKGRMKS